VNITILGPAENEEAAAMRERVKAAIERDLMPEGAAAVLLVYSSATRGYRIEAANEHLSGRGRGGTLQIRNRTADVRSIIEKCGARVDGS
jgi:hypothetical protein